MTDGTRTRRTSLLTTMLATVALVGIGASPVVADDAELDVAIVNPIYVDDSGDAKVTGGPFTATGAAVEDGLLCATGTLTELHAHREMLPDDDFRVLVLKQLTCEDRPGALEIALWVDVVEGVGNAFEWQALWGTEALAGICGSGDGAGEWAEDPSVIDSYAGHLRTGDDCSR